MVKISFKKFLFAFVAFIFVFSMMTSVLATNDIALNTPSGNETQNTTQTAQGTTSLEIVEDTVCHIDVGGIGEFEKKITDYDATEKSVTLTLTMTNTKEVEESSKDVEIFFVIDNSSSMVESYIGDKTRKQAVIDSANSLVDKLFASNPNVKIGVVGFSSLDTTAGETEGTINDATLRLELSNSQDDVKGAITNLSTLDVGPRTNIEAGLTIAQGNFSDEKNVNRYVVLLTDGVPNNDTNGTFGTYSGVVATRTKAKLEEMENAGTQIVAAMINLDSETIEPTTGKTYRALAEEIFGTEENPTAGSVYYVSDDEVEDTIVNDIFNNLVVTTDNTLRNITITDYFPQEIIDNFNFEYVASPNIGEVSQSIDTTNNSITWNIELLSEGEVATLVYKLTLKDDYDEEIIDQVLPTNTHVDITGENNGEQIDSTSDESPTIVVKYEEPTITPPDNTVSPDPIPQTGEGIGLIVSIVAIIAIAVISRMVYLKKFSK